MKTRTSCTNAVSQYMHVADKGLVLVETCLAQWVTFYNIFFPALVESTTIAGLVYIHKFEQELQVYLVNSEMSMQLYTYTQSTLSYQMSTFHSVIGSGNETQLKELVK